MSESKSTTEQSEDGIQHRRSVLRLLAGAVGALFAAVFGVPAVAVATDPAARDVRGGWADAGSLADLTPGTARRFTYAVLAGWEERDETGYLVMVDGKPVAFRSRCTHLGCRVRFRDGAFRCPCHGGVFSLDGAPQEGPVTRPLETLPTRIEQGRVQVRT